MAGGLFILPENENASGKRSKENDNSSRFPIIKRVRRSYEPDPSTRRPRGSQIHPPVKNQRIVRGYQFYRNPGGTNIPIKDTQSRASSSSSTGELIPGRTFKVPSGSSSEGQFIPGTTFRAPSGSSGSSTERFTPGVTFAVPLESSSSESRRSSLALERISYEEIMHDIELARKELRDALSGRRSSRRLSNLGEPIRELTRENLARHRRAERRRLVEERRKAASQPPPPLPSLLGVRYSHKNAPVFRKVNWDKGASQSYEDDNV
ncbi:uncharacterized protein F4812DRAFT_260041 [Daldinia caldariorum]|uniref:uncharacterized protein n=1 Tax=Daldinia caldariorum TaxID=326644 RepID=UPI002008B18B|nr:uncharacterized protein F4812DRAFT_260041 [Daldinia caldariorum]KAI1470289.1 hypothetical protein F4812DRAFT_260041 [Daldinia caldariorum]